MTDLISKSALFREFSDFVRASNNSDLEKLPTWNDAVSLVGSAPTIEPKRGKWIKIGDCDAVQCSECLDDFDYIDGLCYLCHGQELPNYCPNCGAMMFAKDIDVLNK